MKTTVWLDSTEVEDRGEDRVCKMDSLHRKFCKKMVSLDRFSQWELLQYDGDKQGMGGWTIRLVKGKQ